MRRSLIASFAATASVIAIAMAAPIWVATAPVPAKADAHTASDLVTVGPSAHDVATTIDRLSATLTAKGITVMARFDHAAGAEKAGMDLPPTQVLVFGNPKLGTPLMKAGRTIALDLPMKVLAWEDTEGKVWLTYRAPVAMAGAHGISEPAPVLQKMTGALANFTAAAVAADQ